MEIKPLGNQILVKRDSEEAVSPGGIVIPETAHNSKVPRGRGVVIAVGPGKRRKKDGKREPMDVQIGQRVIFSKFSGDKVRDDLAMSDAESDLVLISEDQVMCVMEDGG